MKKVLWIVVIAILVIVAKQQFWDKNKATDVTDLRNASTTQIESELDLTLTSCPEMADRVYEYSEIGTVTVKGDSKNGVGVVYLNGVQNGFRIENSQYTMFGITIGKSRVGMESAMTFQSEDKFEINEGVEKELTSKNTDFPIFYCNWTNNDCVVVSCDKSTGIVLAVTYFNNASKVTERLVSRGKK